MVPLLIVFIIFIFDQASKVFISHILELNQTLPIIKNIFGLTLIHNRGAAFGIFKNQLFIFIITSIAAVILISYSLKAKKHSRYYVICLSLILAGALGNLIDRLRFGYVIDFLNFYIWPVFNIADSSITIGAILLGWALLKGKD